MVELIDYIDDQIKSCIPECDQYGLCHLLNGDNETFPATVEKNAKKVSFDDRFDVVTYHRLLNGSIEPREDASFGKTITPQNNQRVRLVVATKLGEDTRIDDIINALPDSFDMDDYGFVNVSQNITLIRDREAVWNIEFPQAYRDKYQMKWNLYAVEYDLQYIKCNVCV